MSFKDRPMHSEPTAADVLALARRLPLPDQARLVLELLGLPDLPEWLSYAQAGQVLRRSPSTICRLAKRDRLKTNGRRGHAKRVARASVLALKVEASQRAASTVARIVGRFNCISVSSPVPFPPHPAT